MDGIILVHKPPDITSHFLVSRISQLLGVKKVGHFGTLDPLATGLILVGVGKATRLFSFFLKADKIYQGKIKLGFSTDTYDTSGKPTSKENSNYPSRKILLEHMKTFQGKMTQLSPPYSAKKYRGSPLYKLARENKNFTLKTYPVRIDYFRLLGYEPPIIQFSLKCSSGTYVRTTAHDLGQKLGCGAHLLQLKRTGIGRFRLHQSYTLEEIKSFSQKAQFKKFLRPMETLLPEFPSITVENRLASLVSAGNDISTDSTSQILNGDPSRSQTGTEEKNIVRVFDKKGKLLAFARKNPQKNSLHPFYIVDSADKSR